jgi:hypothetical protein
VAGVVAAAGVAGCAALLDDELLEVDPDVAPDDAGAAGVDALAGVACVEDVELELDLLGADWLGGLLTLIVGLPLLLAGTTTVEPNGRQPPKYIAMARMITIARMTPTMTPRPAPSPEPVEPGGPELI